MFSRLILWLASIGAILLIAGICGVIFVLYYFGRDLPDYSQLQNYQPPIVTRAYANDGRLMAEFAIEKRVFVPVNSIPKIVKDAFIAAEDQNFYTHPGIDITGIARAVHVNVVNFASNRRPVGASTITQQVAKNFLLTNEVSIERKIKEALLAFRIEKTLTKNQILELYLNEIYLGLSAYGVAAAAHEYFNKPLNRLTLEEAAYLAALPKAPNNYHPLRKRENAIARRNWVIDRMLAESFITREEATVASAKELKVVDIQEADTVAAPYVAEEIRRHLITTYGQDSLYKGGLLVRATVDPTMQAIADKALRNGLVAYDRRYGRHGQAVAHFGDLQDWQSQLQNVVPPPGTGDWMLAVVLKAEREAAEIGLEDGSRGVIPLENVTWARKRVKGGGLGPEIKTTVDATPKGDVILVERDGDKMIDKKPVYHFRQIPEVQGGLVALDPHTGRVLAMSGGFSYEMSEFNRATQALRQPGSAFKPFVYFAALEKKFTPATIIMDSPIVLDQGPGLGKWRPVNYNNDYLGPTTMRVGLEKSRNLMTIRLAMFTGMDNVEDVVKRFGVANRLPYGLATSLGSGETTLLRMASAYAVFANGGRKIEPSVIDRIQDRSGKTIYTHDKRACDGCGPLQPWSDSDQVPSLAELGTQIADPRLTYQMTSMLEGVVQRGTATSLKSLNRPIAGKTGTTNDSKDTWFIGYTPDLVVATYVGYDEPRNMGRKETGGRIAVPIVKEFMEQALKDTPPVPFRMPEGIKMVLVNRHTGTRAGVADKDTLWEAFVTGNEPGNVPTVYNDGAGGVTLATEPSSNAGQGASTGTGGLY